MIKTVILAGAFALAVSQAFAQTAQRVEKADGKTIVVGGKEYTVTGNTKVKMSGKMSDIKAGMMCMLYSASGRGDSRDEVAMADCSYSEVSK